MFLRPRQTLDANTRADDRRVVGHASAAAFGGSGKNIEVRAAYSG